MSGLKAVDISSPDTKLNCRILGEGTKSAICFHGFGQDGSAFLPILDAKSDFTLYSFDLPFHGGSTVHDFNSCLNEEEICTLVELLLNEYSIDRFSIFAFSIGAKFVSPLAAKFGARIDYIGLLAPDGLLFNFWYKIATINTFSRAVFRFIMKNPGMLKSGIQLCRFMHLIDFNTYSLVEKSTSSAKQGERVYYSWLYLRKLKPDIKLLSNVAVENGFDIDIVSGKHDKIIPEKKLTKAIRGLLRVQLVSVIARHDNVIRKYADCKGTCDNA